MWQHRPNTKRVAGIKRKVLMLDKNHTSANASLPEGRHGTGLGIVGVILLVIAATVLSLYMPSHVDESMLNRASAVAW